MGVKWMSWKSWVRRMAYNIAVYNAFGFLPLGVYREPGVSHTSHLFARFEKNASCILWKESREICDRALRVFEYRMDIVRATKGA
jgi:hypothetical protein